MECKIVVGDPSSGKSYSIEAKAEQSGVFIGKKIGDVVSGNSVGLKGYELQITGGSDKSGFPVVPSVEGQGRVKMLFEGAGTGYNLEGEGVRRRKTVHKNIIGDDISQINTKVVKKGGEKIEKLLGIGQEAGEEAATKGEAKEALEDAPKEKAKEDVKKEVKEATKEEAKEEDKDKEPSKGEAKAEKKE